MNQPRSDSWAAKLTEEQQEELYEKAKETPAFADAIKWAQEEFGLEKAPSRSAFYRWTEKMERGERQRRMAEVAAAAAETATFGKNAPTDETLVATFNALAAKAAMDGNTKAAAEYVKCGDAVHRRMTQEKRTDMERRKTEILEKQEARTANAANPPIPPTPLETDAAFRKKFGLPRREIGHEKLYDLQDFRRAAANDMTCFHKEHLPIVLGWIPQEWEDEDKVKAEEEGEGTQTKQP